MKTILTCIFAFVSLMSFGQEITTIRVSVLDKTDEVYIAGNQENLGNWQAEKVKLHKISDYEREITLSLHFPAEFKFTRGSWDSEGYIHNFFEDKPNIVLGSSDSVSFEVKSWKDRPQKKGYFKYDFEIEYHFSEILGEERAIALKLPSDFNPHQKYSVIYILDAHDLLNPFLVTTNLLSRQKNDNGIDYAQDNIPPVIVVGIIHNHRNKDVGPKMDYKKSESENVLTASSNKFKDYLFSELVSMIDKRFNTSGYNVIVGHSNSGHFVLNLPTFKNNPFKGIIALSVNGENDDYATQVKGYLKTANDKIFFGYGVLDYGFNELAINVESQIENKEFTNENVKIESFVAGHNQLPALAASSALKFIFNDYRNHTRFIEESQKEGFKLNSYLENYVNVHKKYGLNIEITKEDLFTISEMTVNQNNMALFHEIIELNSKQANKIENHYIFWLAREIMDYETADKIINNLIETKDEVDILYTYYNYQAYVDYLIGDKNSPEKALALFKNMFDNTEEFKLEFAFVFSKVAFDNNIELKQARKFKDYCKQNFRENRLFDRNDIDYLK